MLYLKKLQKSSNAKFQTKSNRKAAHKATCKIYGFQNDYEESDDCSESDRSNISEESVTDNSEDNTDCLDDDSDSMQGNVINDNLLAEWNFVTETCDTSVPTVINFRGDPGINPSFQNMDLHTISSILNMLFTPQLWNQLTDWTNMRARVYDEDNYSDISIEEMKQYLGLIFLTGVIRKPQLRMYWSTDEMVSTPYFSNSKIMARNRFLYIHRCLRFGNPACINNDKSSRLLQYFQILRRICQSAYESDECLCVDETLLLWKGRLSFKQFIPTKRSRFGIKSYILCESSGYMLDFDIYYGAKSEKIIITNDSEHLSVSERLVVNLLQSAKVLDKGYTVVIDNYFMSLRLAEYLLGRQTNTIGTIKCTRGVPKILSCKKLSRLSSCFLRKKSVLITKYTDKRDVYLLSTNDKAKLLPKSRKVKGNETQIIQLPLVIDKYNKKKLGVDKADQLLKMYNPVRKSYTWHKKLGIHYLHRLLLNAFILFKKINGGNMSFLDFTCQCISLLTNVKSTITRRRHFTTTGNLQAIKHYLELIPLKNNNVRKYRKCHVCADKNLRKETSYQCAGCDGKPSLCVKCFKEWHNIR